MLKELLRIMAKGQTYSHADLARRLRVSGGLVKQMLEDLSRQGYLEPLSTACAGGCYGCASAGACNMMQPVKIWTLTEKGREAAR